MTTTDTILDSPHETTVETTDDTQVKVTLITILLALVGWGICFAIWGLPGLYLPALALVPVVFVSFILITIGK